MSGGMNAPIFCKNIEKPLQENCSSWYNILKILPSRGDDMTHQAYIFRMYPTTEQASLIALVSVLFRGDN